MPINGWHATHHEECLTFTTDEEGGAFQLSSYRKQTGEVTEADIQSTLDELDGSWSIPFSVVYGDFCGACVHALRNEDCWYWWHLSAGPILLRASYFGPLHLTMAHITDVEAMLATLRLEQEDV